MSFFEELKRRNVIRVAAAYLVAAWLIVQVVETIFPAFGFGAYGNLADQLARAGRLEEAQAAAETAVELSPGSSFAAAYLIAIVHAWRGETDPAFAWLNRALDEGQPLARVRTELYLRSLHGDPRWEMLLERAGVSDSQVSAIQFDVPDAS